jgi:methyl-accepting chemotaxis protein
VGFVCLCNAESQRTSRSTFGRGAGDTSAMKMSRHAVATLIVIVAVTIGAMSFISNRLFSGLTTAVEEGQYELMQSTVESMMRSAESRAHARAAIIADMPNVQRLLAARDRDGLFTELQPMFNTQHSQFAAAAMQFHEPPATTFLRLHNRASFGEDLSGFRPMVVSVNRDHAPAHGFAITRSGVSVTAVVPIHAPDGSHTGSFEISLEFDPLLDDLEESFGLHATLFVQEAPLREIATRINPAVFDEANRVGTYVKVYSTNWDVTQILVQGDDLSGLREPVRLSRNAHGRPYGVLIYPLHLANGEVVGSIVVARDFSPTREAAGRSVVWQALLALFALVVLAGSILIVIRGYLLRPLATITARFGDLSQGKREEKIANIEFMPEELRALGEQYEALRTNGIADVAPEAEREDAS